MKKNVVWMAALMLMLGGMSYAQEPEKQDSTRKETPVLPMPERTPVPEDPDPTPEPAVPVDGENTPAPSEEDVLTPEAVSPMLR